MDGLNRDVRNEELLNNLLHAYDLIRRENELKDNIANAQSGYRSTATKYKKIWKGFQPIGRKALLFLLFECVSEKIFPEYDFLIWLITDMGFVKGNLTNVLIWAAEGVISVVMILCVQMLMNVKIRAHNRKEARRSEENKVYNEQLKNFENEKKVQLQKVVAQYNRDCGDWYPYAYKNEDACGFILKQVESYQAHTLNEAIRQYTDELERRRIAKLQADQLNEQKRHNIRTENQQDIHLLNEIRSASAMESLSRRI